MQNELTISLIQYDIAWENTDVNLTKLERMLERVPAETQLVILPEMFSTGFTMMPFHIAESMQGRMVSWMRETAVTSRKAICGSLIIKEGGRYYNRLIFAKPDGIIHHYDKRHLFTHSGENEHYTAGNQRLILNYLGWRICPLICYDLRFPVWSANRNDYDLLIYVANWPAKRHNVWEILPLARAIENQCYLAAVNRVGNDNQGSAHNGLSRVINFKGEVMAESALHNEEIVTATLSFEKLHEARKRFDFTADADNFGIFA